MYELVNLLHAVHIELEKGDWERLSREPKHDKECIWIKKIPRE
jgi:hypothetical protein